MVGGALVQVAAAIVGIGFSIGAEQTHIESSEKAHII